MLKPIAIYGCETWSTIHKDKAMLSMKNVLKEEFGPVTERGIRRTRTQKR
jgi:hypothetical protein